MKSWLGRLIGCGKISINHSLKWIQDINDILPSKLYHRNNPGLLQQILKF